MNLNVFIPSLLLLQTFVRPLFLALTPRGFPALGMHEVSATLLALVLSYLMPLAILVGVWARHGLIPASRGPSREWRYRNGHRILVVTTTLTVATRILTEVLGHSTSIMSVWLLVVLPFTYVAWPIGLYMVWSSRA